MTATMESLKLRGQIRSGAIDCPDNGRRCRRDIAEHCHLCQWQWAIERIYELEREDEGDTGS